MKDSELYFLYGLVLLAPTSNEVASSIAGLLFICFSWYAYYKGR